MCRALLGGVSRASGAGVAGPGELYECLCGLLKHPTQASSGYRHAKGKLNPACRLNPAEGEVLTNLGKLCTNDANNGGSGCSVCAASDPLADNKYLSQSSASFGSIGRKLWHFCEFRHLNRPLTSSLTSRPVKYSAAFSAGQRYRATSGNKQSAPGGSRRRRVNCPSITRIE